MVEDEQEHVGEILSKINTGATYRIPIVHYNTLPPSPGIIPMEKKCKTIPQILYSVWKHILQKKIYSTLPKRMPKERVKQSC